MLQVFLYSLLNPHELQIRDWADTKGATIFHDDKERVKINLLKDYVPTNHEFPAITQLMKKMPSKIFNMLAAGEASDKKVVVCIVKVQGSKGSVMMSGKPGAGGSTEIGDLDLNVSFKTSDLVDYMNKEGGLSGRRVESKGGTRNPIEEINALRSLCDRTNAAKSDAIQEHKTTCERDLVEELCSSVNFGQKDKSCGEAETEKDSLYSLELEPDVRSGNEIHGIYSDCISLVRKNKKVPVSLPSEEGASKMGYLYQDTREAKYAVSIGEGGRRTPLADQALVKIIYPSENRHNAMIIYNRNLTITDLGVRKVFDPINGSIIQINPKASSVSYQLKDISQDITSLINEERKNQIQRSEIPQNIVADIDNITAKDGDRTYRLLQNVTAQAYHERLRGNISDIQIVEPRKSYTFKIYISNIKKDMKDFIKLLTPENGLDSLSINMDEGGLSISVSLSNRASADVALQEIFNKVGPLAREVKDKYATQRSNNA